MTNLFALLSFDHSPSHFVLTYWCMRNGDSRHRRMTCGSCPRSHGYYLPVFIGCYAPGLPDIVVANLLSGVANTLTSTNVVTCAVGPQLYLC